MLSKVEAKQVAVMAHDGFPRALYPVHSPGDGDLLFTLSTGARALGRDALSLLALGTAAANVVARAIAQGRAVGTEMMGRLRESPSGGLASRLE